MDWHAEMQGKYGTINPTVLLRSAQQAIIVERNGARETIQAY